MKHLLIAALCFTGLLCLTACHKHDTSPKQYSTWIVNGQDTFRTNDVDTHTFCNPDQSYCRASLKSNNSSNQFSIYFALGYFPTSGKYELYIPPGGGSVTCAVNFYYNNQSYYHTPSTIDTLYVSLNNGRASYSMPACWFVNYNNTTGDSILIQGVFNIP